jgi:hypothetical protein
VDADRGSQAEQELVVTEKREEVEVEGENSDGFIHDVGTPCLLA